jgi:GMP synthase-like glutamine amidotransferase
MNTAGTVHLLQHAPHEAPGHIITWLEAAGLAYTVHHLYRGAALPSLAPADWLLVLGGPMGPDDEHSYPWLRAEKQLIETALPRHRVLGICLGAQLIASVLGARVYPALTPEKGWWPVHLTDAAYASPVFQGLPGSFPAFHWHADTFDLPAGATHLARTPDCPMQAFSYGPRVLGLQFHLETTPVWLEALLAAEPPVPDHRVQPAQEMRDGLRIAQLSQSYCEQVLTALAQAAPA